MDMNERWAPEDIPGLGDLAVRCAGGVCGPIAFENIHIINFEQEGLASSTRGRVIGDAGFVVMATA